MAYNDITKQWEIESENETLLRLLQTYNEVVPNANMDVNKIKGSGLEGILYTYIHGFYDILQSGILDLEAKMTFAIKDATAQVLRPNLIKDNIITYASKLSLELAVYDLNDVKMEGLPEGLYLVVKRTLTLNQESEAIASVGKNCVVAGVIMRGDTEINTTLSSGQQLIIRYTLAVLLPFKIKVQVRTKTTTVDSVNLIEGIKADIFNYFTDTYKIGNDFNPTEIQGLLIAKYSNLSDIFIYYSLDDGLIYTIGSCIIPYNNYIDVDINDILVEVV